MGAGVAGAAVDEGDEVEVGVSVDGLTHLPAWHCQPAGQLPVLELRNWPVSL